MKKIKKNLTTCKPSEFLVQTIRIRHLVKDWADDVASVRKVPELTDKMTRAEKYEAVRKQMAENFWAVLDVVTEKRGQETLELLALMNFIEPEHVDDYEMGDYLDNVGQMLGDERIINFFTSVALLDRRNILTPAKR